MIGRTRERGRFMGKKERETGEGLREKLGERLGGGGVETNDQT